MAGDGDGWVTCAFGHRHWGRFGAAGLLLRDEDQVVLQHRAVGTHEGGSWALAGGARDSHEDAVETASREAREEAGILPHHIRPVGTWVADHLTWSYTTVVARAVGSVVPYAANWESVDVRWCDLAEVDTLPLHPAFASAWPALRMTPEPLTVVIDAANVIGSRPDGWWRDRAGATRALRTDLVALARDGIPAVELPTGILALGLSRLLPRIVLVVEGGAVDVALDAPGAGWWEAAVTAVAAPGSGDDTVVEVAASLPGQVLVVTADRGLRARLPTALAVAEPRWLLDHLPR